MLAIQVPAILRLISVHGPRELGRILIGREDMAAQQLVELGQQQTTPDVTAEVMYLIYLAIKQCFSISRLTPNI